MSFGLRLMPFSSYFKTRVKNVNLVPGPQVDGGPNFKIWCRIDGRREMHRDLEGALHLDRSKRPDLREPLEPVKGIGMPTWPANIAGRVVNMIGCRCWPRN
jgi:hypothetical protein